MDQDSMLRYEAELHLIHKALSSKGIPSELQNKLNVMAHRLYMSRTMAAMGAPEMFLTPKDFQVVRTVLKPN